MGLGMGIWWCRDSVDVEFLESQECSLFSAELESQSLQSVYRPPLTEANSLTLGSDLGGSGWSPGGLRCQDLGAWLKQQQYCLES